ncbi:MAG: hypothetical protein ACRDRD_08020, partial [Pseudonocardiaceae bacterium]
MCGAVLVMEVGPSGSLRFYRSELTNLLHRLNRHLLRWACHQHKGLGHRKARRRLAEVARAY